jgi:YVTN family beta-propeller protein
MVAKDGKVYISYFYGHEVAVLDTASLKIEQTVSVGRYPEKLAAANGKIYVTNSGGLDYPNYGNTVSVIDPETMTVEDEIEVLINPASIIADSEGDLYVVSLGDYGDVKNTLQRIDKATGEVSTICNASKIALANDKIYLMYAQWGVETPEFKIYDTLAEEIVDENFVKDGTAITSPNAITVDPVTEKIYITYYDYMSTASLYIFDKDGKLEGSPIDTGGYDSKWMFVLND